MTADVRRELARKQPAQVSVSRLPAAPPAPRSGNGITIVGWFVLLTLAFLLAGYLIAALQQHA